MSIVFGLLKASNIAFLVISLKITLFISTSFNLFFSDKNECICHAIASPSLSESVANHRVSPLDIDLLIAWICFFLSSCTSYFIKKSSSGITDPFLFGRSLICP